MSHALVLCGSEVSKSKGGASSIRSQLSKKNTLPSVESKPNTDDILHACAPLSPPLVSQFLVSYCLVTSSLVNFL